MQLLKQGFFLDFIRFWD